MVDQNDELKQNKKFRKIGKIHKKLLDGVLIKNSPKMSHFTFP